MRISGFSMVRNGIKLYYPVVEMIKSILPIVDEFIIAIGEGDEDDNTRGLVAAIKDPKIKIIDTIWNIEKYPRGMENAHQTDIAKNECSGDWLFYLQADEVIHEKYLPVIQTRCKELLNNEEIEGLLFKYKHFWGDYYHYHKSHGWYPYEIRIIRNLPKIHSYQSAQSFRRFDFYDNPRQEKGTHKLKVASLDAHIYHYGWVRPPHLMQSKKKALDSVHLGKKKAKEYYDKLSKKFDYGPLNRLPEFKGTHPKVMMEMIGKMNWKDRLQYSGKPNPVRELHKHERFKYRFLTWLERNIFSGKQVGSFRNYLLMKKI